MANAVWPASLPQRPLVEDYEETLPATALRTEMDAGPAKIRRRFTAGIRPLRMSLSLTEAQVATLDAFYDTTLAGGSLPFDWLHPRTQAAATFRFLAPPRLRLEAKDLWWAEMAAEILP